MEFSDGSVDEGEKLIWLDAESEPMFNLLHLEPGYRASTESVFIIRPSVGI